MREKWHKSGDYRGTSEGRQQQPVMPHRIAMFDDSTYVPKLVQKAPSMRAIKNYNDTRTDLDDPKRFTYNNNDDDDEDGRMKNEDEPVKSDQRIDDYFAHNHNRGFDHDTPIIGHIYTTDEPCDYPTIKSSSGATFVGSENGTDRLDDLGSTSKLVNSKMQRSCTKYYNYLEIVFCAVSIANGFGNVYRLPQAVLNGGGLPFLVVYVVLSLLVGLPLLFLEIGVGQIVQEGFTKTWRAVPFFRGVGYVKLFVGCLLCIYFPIYMGLSFYYVVWLSKGQLPFPNCSGVQLRSDGYRTKAISVTECLRKTFLSSAFEEEHSWYGIYASLLLLVWTVLLILCVKQKKTYSKTLLVLLLPTLGSLLALAIRGLMFNGNLDGLTENIDWNLLGTSKIWYFAAVEVFFSTQIGFGVFVTNAGVLFDKANPYWTSFGYTLVNLIVGILSVLTVYLYGDGVKFQLGDTLREFSLLTYVYDVGASPLGPMTDQEKIGWLTVYYLMIVFSGFISMMTIIYIVLKSITIESNKRFQWWQVALILCFLSFLFCAIVTLDTDLKLIRILDYYVVGNLIMLTVITEVLSFLIFYGSQRIHLDFEFILGEKLSKLWIALWYVASIGLLALFLWAAATLGPYLDAESVDAEWMYVFAWSVIVICVIFVLYTALHTINDQDEYYTFVDKFKASFKSSRKWGPIDPIFRYEWVQWHSKAKDGERDFTLKRRGTKDYAHSVKKRSKRSYDPTASDVSTVTGSITFRHNEPRTTATAGAEPRSSDRRSNAEVRPLTVTSAQLRAFDDNVGLRLEDGGDDYDTFGRKGPYVICKEELSYQHVCHKNNNNEEMATEL